MGSRDDRLRASLPKSYARSCSSGIVIRVVLQDALQSSTREQTVCEPALMERVGLERGSMVEGVITTAQLRSETGSQ